MLDYDVVRGTDEIPCLDCGGVDSVAWPMHALLPLIWHVITVQYSYTEPSKRRQ